MSIRQKIRDYLDGCDGPMWACEIVKATGCTPQAISKMVTEGALLRHEGAQVQSYSVGRRPVPTLSEDERRARRRAVDRRRDALRKKPKSRRGSKEQPTIKRTQIVLASSHATVGGESVTEFLSRGGRIEKLPGIQTSNVYQQRRPVMAAYRSLSA